MTTLSLRRAAIALTLVPLVSLLGACQKKDGANDTATNEDSIAQQVGDAMASIDESGGSSGSYSLLANEHKLFASLAPGLAGPPAREFAMTSVLLPKAHAASCLTGTWLDCSRRDRRRDQKGRHIE